MANANGAMLPVKSNPVNNHYQPPIHPNANVHYVYPFMYTQRSTGTHRRCTSTIRKCPVANNDRYYGDGNNYNTINNNYYQTTNNYYN